METVTISLPMLLEVKNETASDIIEIFGNTEQTYVKPKALFEGHNYEKYIKEFEKNPHLSR